MKLKWGGMHTKQRHFILRSFVSPLLRMEPDNCPVCLCHGTRFVIGKPGLRTHTIHWDGPLPLAVLDGLDNTEIYNHCLRMFTTRQAVCAYAFLHAGQVVL